MRIENGIWCPGTITLLSSNLLEDMMIVKNMFAHRYQHITNVAINLHRGRTLLFHSLSFGRWWWMTSKKSFCSTFQHFFYRFAAEFSCLHCGGKDLIDRCNSVWNKFRYRGKGHISAVVSCCIACKTKLFVGDTLRFCHFFAKMRRYIRRHSSVKIDIFLLGLWE